MANKTAEELLGERVRELRNKRGWSQERLAQQMSEAGFPWRQTTTAKTEAADRPVRVNEAAALAVVLGVPLPVLIDPGMTEESAQELHGIQRAKAELAAVEADLESVQRRIKARWNRLNHESVVIEVKQAQRRWGAARERSDGEHRTEA